MRSGGTEPFFSFQKICEGKFFEMVSWGGLGGLAPLRNLRYPCLAPRGGLGGFAPQESPLPVPCLRSGRALPLCLAPNFFRPKNFSTENFFGRNCFRPKNFSAENFLAENFSAEHFFRRKFFSAESPKAEASFLGGIFSDTPLQCGMIGLIINQNHATIRQLVAWSRALPSVYHAN